MIGFTLFIKGKDVFIETNKVRKTKELARQIIRKLNGTGMFEIPDNAAGIDSVLYYLQKAKCELRELPSGRQYYEISGENFGGKGSFIDDGKTIIVKL